MEQPEVFAELVRYALAEWTSEVVESVRTDKKFATLLENRWLALVGEGHHDRHVPVEAQLQDEDLRHLLVMAVHEVSGLSGDAHA